MVSGKIKGSFSAKLITVLTTLTFLFSGMAFPATEKAVNPATAQDPTAVLSVEDIGIAIDNGTIKSKYSGSKGKVIIHIQDAHCNYSAQISIAKIVSYFRKHFILKQNN